jgi:hypothetical protein
MKEKSRIPPSGEGMVWIDLKDPNRGRSDRVHMPRHQPHDHKESESSVTDARIAATLALMEKQKHRGIRKAG